MKTSDFLKNFRFEKGEHTVVLRPKKNEYDQKNSRLQALAMQIVGELAWFNPGKVLLLTSPECRKNFHEKFFSYCVETALGILPYAGTDVTTAMTRAAIYSKLNSKIVLAAYDASKEEARGGLEENLRHIIKKAEGSVSAIVVDRIEMLAITGGEAVTVNHSIEDGTITNVAITTLPPNPRWTHRYAEILTTIGKIAKENNICAVSCATPMLHQEGFNRVSSLGLRGVWHWYEGPSESVDRLYGIQYRLLPLSCNLDEDPWQTLVEYNVATKEITKTDIFDNSENRCGFICHEKQKLLDNLAVN